MDISDITKVASRKRISEDAEKLREKVSRETAKIIKLKVAQDTAYWDLKEKLQQVEANHERLQQNMVEVQMQHEATSGQYQDELRLRPETLNKVQGARRVCSVLEEAAARARAAGARAAADRSALCGALRTRACRCGGPARTSLQRACCGCAERRDDCATSLAASEARARRALQAAQEERGRAERRAEEARAREDAERTLLRCKLQQKEDFVENLQKEIERLQQELRDRIVEADNTIENLKLGLQRSDDARAALQRSLALSEQQGAELRDQHQRLQLQLQDAQASLEASSRAVEELKEQNDSRQRTLERQNEALGAASAQVEQLTARAAALEDEKADAVCSLRAELSALQARHDDVQGRFQSFRAESEAREAAAGASVAALMRDVQAEGERRHKLEAALGAARDLAAQRERMLADKEDELNKQMSIILDMRNEKERLQEKIQSMQNTIDNVQKELSGRGAGRGGAQGEAPQQDAPPRPLDPVLYNFLSDTSLDADALDTSEVRRRFEALSGGRRAGAAQRAPRPAPQHAYPQSPVSLSQVKLDLKTKHKSFFKNKRVDLKTKKLK
ncbi:myosin-14-like [Bombyx mandarina]|uniref:Myosin-14-like n=1 Tax=Bombyx mandarina TaxID=7092 RepID=A0A6J2KMN5_BOMMA|nr:myosin-14-like [Bombyx mandarina]